MDDIEADIEGQMMAQVEETEAIAVSLGVLARPVREADIPAAAAVEMLAGAPALLEQAIQAGEAARVAYMVRDRQAYGRLCRDDAELAEFFTMANGRGATVTAVSPARVMNLARGIRRVTAGTLRPAATGGLADAAIH